MAAVHQRAVLVTGGTNRKKTVYPVLVAETGTRHVAPTAVCQQLSLASLRKQCFSCPQGRHVQLPGLIIAPEIPAQKVSPSGEPKTRTRPQSFPEVSTDAQETLVPRHPMVAPGETSQELTVNSSCRDSRSCPDPCLLRGWVVQLFPLLAKLIKSYFCGLNTLGTTL